LSFKGPVIPWKAIEDLMMMVTKLLHRNTQ